MRPHETLRDRRRAPLAGTAAALSLLLLAFFAPAGRAGATCPAAGVADVRVAFIDRDGNGVPDVESDDKARNERARISSSLAAQLGISLPSDPEVFPQVRVIAQNQDLASGDPAMGVFSVFEVYPGAVDEIQVWADEDSGDDESGEYRLFEDVTVADLSAVRLTAHRQAVSSTSIATGGGAPQLTQHYCEPAPYSRFTESAAIETDKRFVVLAPHGGEIEPDTSEQIATIGAALAGRGVAASSWDVQGYWHDDEDESEHWHVTSDEVTAAGFPGLAALLAAPPYDAQRQFQYAASLHGMSYDSEGMILGGRASREAKCLIASRVRERMAAEGLPVPAVFIWNYDKDEDLSIELPHGDPNVPTITDERGDDPGVSGTSRDNIVNRLSPNENGAPGFGGIQIEQSRDLRDDDPLPQFSPAVVSYRDLVAEEIGHAFGELLTKPGLVVPGSTAICDALVAGDPIPAAEIRGRVWRDLDGDAARGAADPAVPGVEVELLDASGTAIDSAVTDADGRYAFPGHAAGSYRVRHQTSPVFVLVAKDQAGGNDALDSDLDPATGASDLLVLAAYELAEDVDAGIALAAGTASVGDRVWADDGDGVQGPLEDGLEDVAVTLLDEAGTTVAATVTDGGGFYSFTGLPAGGYRLRFAPDAGYEPVEPGQGNDPSLDSDVDAGFEAEVTLGAGEQDLTVDAGFAIDCVDATLVAFGSSWSWSTVESAGWNDTGFVEDEDWTRAQASLGYGLAVESTIADGGGVAYFRLPFEVEEPSVFDQLDLLLLRSDGAVVYLNGVEVLRSNVPLAGTGSAVVAGAVDASGLVEGTNVLAVEVHEADGTLAFDLEVSTRTCRPCLTSQVLTADRVTYLRDGSSTVRGSQTVANMDADTQENALFGWPVESLPDDAEILHAEIRWRVTDDSPDAFHLYPLLKSWDEGTAHWFRRRAGTPVVGWALNGANDEDLDHQGDEPLAAIRFTDDPPFSEPPYTGTIVLNLAGREWVQGWVRGERANHGILVPGEGSGNKLAVDSDDGAQPPVLEVVYRSCTP